MLFRSRGGGGGGGGNGENGEQQRNRQIRSPLADRNERNVIGHFISTSTGKEGNKNHVIDENKREDFVTKAIKKKNEKTTTKTTTSVSVCPDIIREYRETTSTRSLTENEIQINSRRNPLGEEEAALTKISTTGRTKNSYKKMKLLGKGGFAIVYSVKDLNKKPSSSRDDDGVESQSSSYNYYAAKVVSKKNLERQKQKDKMLAEIRIHRQAEHELIVKFKKCFEDEMNVYILMEKCSDRTLADVIKYRGAITETETTAYVWEISQAMQYLHEKLVVHRDLKLGNVFLTDYGLKEASAMADESESVLRRFQTGEERLKAFERMERSFLLESGSSSSNHHHSSGRQPRIKIGDFGLAVQLAHKREKKFTVCGTPNYIAPEVLAGSQGPGHNSASDIWSLGVIIYALLCGEPPFQTESVEATYNRIRKTDFGFPDDRQCLKVLSSEHLLMNVTTTTTTKKNNNNNNNSDENNKNSTKNENVPNLPKYRFPISATSRDLVKRCLLAEAEKRLTGVEILEHPFFDVVWAAANNHQTAATIQTTRMTEYDNRNRNIIIADAMTTSSTTPRRAASVPLKVSSSNKAHQNQSPMHSALESISGLRQMEAETKHALQQHQHALNGQKSWMRRTRSATMGGSTTTTTTTTTTERENIESARVALAHISVNAGNGGAQTTTTTTSPPITMTSSARTNDQIRSSGLSTSSSANNNNDNDYMPLSARIKVKHFTNQTEQWGLGYALTDNSFGAIFNDESRAVLTKCGKCVFYWPNNVSATSAAHSSSAEKRISPRKKFSSKMCIAVPLRHAQSGNAGDDHFNRDLAKKTAILLRFKEILLRKEEEFSRGCNDENEINEDDDTTTTKTEKRKKVEKENLRLDPHDPNYYYDKNPLFDISKSISLLLDRGAMINYWRTGRSNATTFTFNDGSFQTLFGDANSTSVFCCDDYSHQHHSSNTNLRGDAYYGGVLHGGGQGVTKRRLAVCEQRKIVLKNLSKVPVSNTSRLSSVSNSPARPSPLGKMKTSSGVSSSSATIRAKVLDAREILSKSARSDTNLEKCVRYCHESGTRLEMQNNNNYNNV